MPNNSILLHRRRDSIDRRTCETQQAQVEAYNDFNYRGNVAAQNSDFEKSDLPSGKRPSHLIRVRLSNVVASSSANSIRAANDTISMLRQRKLQPAEAPKMVTNHSTETVDAERV